MNQTKAQKNVWQDVHAYFKELFMENPQLDHITLSEQQLVTDMSARFENEYNAEMIAKLLKNGFEVERGVYDFKRKDFVPAEVRKVEEAEA